jgi:hypothetical protein
MNTKDILLVGAGVVVGYFLVVFMNKSKDNAEETMDSVEPMDSEEPMVNQAKIDKCNEEVALKLQTVKIANPEALEAFKKQVFEDCMARTV